MPQMHTHMYYRRGKTIHPEREYAHMCTFSYWRVCTHALEIRKTAIAIATVTETETETSSERNRTD